MRNAESEEASTNGDHTQEPSGKRRRRSTWSILVAATVSVVTLTLGWLQLQSAERSVGMSLPDTMFGGYDQAYVELVGQQMTGETTETPYAGFFTWWPLLLSQLISPRTSPLRPPLARPEPRMPQQHWPAF